MDLDEMLRVDRCQDMDELMHAFTMVLVTASCRNNFVGGTCALPSAFLVNA